MTKNWYITGTSRGFGREFAITALERGDRVAATARNLSSLDDLVQKYGDALLPLELDVTDKAAVGETVRRAHEAFGSLDVVVNNAGYGHFGAVEELSEQEIRDQLETNFFGALWVTQAVLPILREQGSGHIIQISTIGGVGAFPNIGAYHASKWALEGLTEALSKEVAELGIKVTLVEPGGFSHRLGRRLREALDADAGLRPRPRGERQAARSGHTRRPASRPARRCSRSWTPTSRRCGSSSGPPAYRWRTLSTRSGSRPGMPGSTSPTPPRAKRWASGPSRRAGASRRTRSRPPWRPRRRRPAPSVRTASSSPPRGSSRAPIGRSAW